MYWGKKMKKWQRASCAIAFGMGVISSTQFSFAQEEAPPQEAIQPPVPQAAPEQPQEAAQPAAPQAAPEQPLEKIEITGSAIRRTDTETPSPVQVITAEDLKRSGYTDVSDVLRNISANGAGSLSQSFNFAFAGGGAGVALRGLSVGATLTLIDGHRMVPYPLSDDAQRSFVDVSAIPFNAVDHIEIVKDGASALYGSDAMAGVVNIILKKSYIGTEVGGEFGVSQQDDGKINHFTGITGFGDLGADGYNGFVSVEYRHQDNILVSNRNGTWNAANPALWTSLGTGTNNLTPGIPNSLNGGSPGSLNSVTGVLVNPGTAATAGMPAYSYLPGCTQTLQQAGRCGFLYPGQEIQPSTQNLNVLGRFTFNFGSGWQSATALSMFNSQAEQTEPFNPSSNGSTNYPGGMLAYRGGPGVTPGPGPGIPAVITVPANYPGNPYGVAAPLIYSFQDIGNPVTEYDTYTYRFVEDLTGTYAGWDVHAAAGVSYADTTSTFTNYIDIPNLQTALNDGTYHVGEAASTNSPNVYSFISPTTYGNGTDLLDFVSLNGQRDVWKLPGGPLTFASGVEYTHRSLNNLNAPLIAQGYDSGLIGFAVGNQDDYGAFVELQGAVIKTLELDFAGRFDHYTTNYGNGGSAAVPKVQFKYTPVSTVSFRGTWGEGYRIPSPAEAGASGAVFEAGTISDTALCPGNGANIPGLSYYFPSQCAISPPNFQVATHTLSPERSTNKTLGVILEPSRNFNFSADYYDIKIRDQIVSGFELGGLQALTSSPVTASSQIRSPPVQLLNSNGATVTTPVGLLIYTAVPYFNATQTETSGIDFDVRTKFDLHDYGQLIGTISFTHVLNYNLTYNGTTWYLAGTQGPSGVSGDTGNPRNRGTLTLTWEKPAYEVTATAIYTGGWDINDPSAGQFTCADGAGAQYSLTYGGGLFAGGAPNSNLCHVASFIEWDLYGLYRIDKHWSVHGSVLNLFNTPPPLDISTYGGPGGGLYSTLDQAGAIGRFYTIGVNYKF